MSISFLAGLGQSNSPSWAFVGSIAHKINTGRAMVTSKNIRKGTQSGIIARSEPQSNWDSFSLTKGIPKDTNGFFPLPTGMMTSHHVEPGDEGPAQEGNIVEARPPQK
jgi:hypothetical protein